MHAFTGPSPWEQDPGHRGSGIAEGWWPPPSPVCRHWRWPANRFRTIIDRVANRLETFIEEFSSNIL
jgi:hypothetical protein